MLIPGYLTRAVRFMLRLVESWCDGFYDLTSSVCSLVNNNFITLSRYTVTLIWGTRKPFRAFKSFPYYLS